MAKSDSLMIGSFGSYRAGGREVPADMVGKKIWYSASHDLFAITDEDGHNISSFGFEKFKEFMDAEVIVYTNSGVESHVKKLLKEKSSPQMGADINGDGYFDGYDMGYDADIANFKAPDDYYENQQPADFSSGYNDVYNDVQDYRKSPAAYRRDASVALEGGADSSAKKTKDPTRHTVGFFITTLILAIVVFILLNFAQPIIEAVAPLLS